MDTREMQKAAEALRKAKLSGVISLKQEEQKPDLSKAAEFLKKKEEKNAAEKKELKKKKKKLTPLQRSKIYHKEQYRKKKVRKTNAIGKQPSPHRNIRHLVRTDGKSSYQIVTKKSQKEYRSKTYFSLEEAIADREEFIIKILKQ